MATMAHIAGVGMTPFGKQTERTIEDIGRQAMLAAMKDANVGRKQIDEVFCGSTFGGSLIGQRILRDLGMTGIPITNVENACSSGAAALREACSAIASGRAETILVLGVEKLTALGGGTLPLEKTDIEANLGAVMPAVYAMRARRYMHETGATAKHLAMISVKAHEFGSRNPYAQFQNRITIDQVLNSRMVADPLTLYMCCPTGDGAASQGPFDVILESVGGDMLGDALGLLAPDGVCVTYGESTGRPAAFDPRPFFRVGGARLYGLFVYEEVRRHPPALALTRLLDLVAGKQLKPRITIEADWADIARVAKDLMDRKIRGKAVIHIT